MLSYHIHRFDRGITYPLDFSLLSVRVWEINSLIANRRVWLSCHLIPVVLSGTGKWVFRLHWTTSRSGKGIVRYAIARVPPAHVLRDLGGSDDVWVSGPAVLLCYANKCASSSRRALPRWSANNTEPRTEDMPLICKDIHTHIYKATTPKLGLFLRYVSKTLPKYKKIYQWFFYTS